MRALRPYSKAVGGGVGAAVVVVAAWVLREFFGVEMPDVVQGALGIILTVAVVYFFPANAPSGPSSPGSSKGLRVKAETQGGNRSRSTVARSSKSPASGFHVLLFVPLLFLAACSTNRSIESELYFSAMTFATIVETGVALHDQGVLVGESWVEFREAAEAANRLLDAAHAAHMLGREQHAGDLSSQLTVALLALEGYVLTPEPAT